MHLAGLTGKGYSRVPIKTRNNYSHSTAETVQFTVFNHCTLYSLVTIDLLSLQKMRISKSQTLSFKRPELNPTHDFNRK